MDVISYAKASSAYKLAKVVETGLTGKVALGGSSIVVPVGTTATRPTLSAGESAIRFNSDAGGLEEWNGSEWQNVSASISAVNLKGTDTEANILAMVGMVAEDLWIASDTLDGYVYDGSTWINIGPLQGPQGVQGVTGKSAYAVAVEGGFVGTEAQWLASLVGPTGATGNGIASVVKTGTVGLVDTYTVTMTNGSTADFTVTNGVDGIDGIDVDHIAQTSGTGAAGTVDVYTVWGDVAETVNLGTFNVYNGTDGTDGTGIVNSVVAGTNVTVDNTDPTSPIVGLGTNVTIQGNTFNGPEQLVRLDVDGKLPVLDGSNLIGIDGLPDQTGFAGKYLKTDGTVATWESASTGTGITNNEFVAIAGQTEFAVTYSGGNLDVYQNGLLLSDTDYVATNGTSVVLVLAATEGDLISVKVYDTFSVADTYTKSETDAKINDEITTAVGSIDLSSKQDVLVSGTNIKSINGNSILGGGNLNISSTPYLTYDNRSLLRNLSPSDGDLYLVELLGLFRYYTTQAEPDDDESCFNTFTGQWLLECPTWDLVDAWSLETNFFDSVGSKIIKSSIYNSISGITGDGQVGWGGTVVSFSTTNSNIVYGDSIIFTDIISSSDAKLWRTASIDINNVITVYIGTSSYVTSNYIPVSVGNWPILIIKG